MSEIWNFLKESFNQETIKSSFIVDWNQYFKIWIEDWENTKYWIIKEWDENLINEKCIFDDIYLYYKYLEDWKLFYNWEYKWK